MKWLDCAVEVSEENKKKEKTRWAVIEKPTSTCFRKKQHSKEFLQYIQLMFFFFICAIIITLES
jgi:hypothetical protein